MGKVNKYKIRKKRRDRKSFEKNRWIRMWRKMPLRFHEYAKTLDVIITPGQKEAAIKLIGMDVAAGKDYSETIVHKHRASHRQIGIAGVSNNRANVLAYALMMGRSATCTRANRFASAFIDEIFEISMIPEEDLEIMKKRMLDRIIHSCGVPPGEIDREIEFASGKALEAKKKDN